MTLDAACLPPGHTPTATDGARATFHADGQLATYGYYQDGVPVGWNLALDPATCTGTATRTDSQVYVAEDEYDAETGEPVTIAYPDWVRAQIAAIARDADGPGMHCSFCEKDNTEVRKLIAGPSSYICNECVDLCAMILAEEVPA